MRTVVVAVAMSVGLTACGEGRLSAQKYQEQANKICASVDAEATKLPAGDEGPGPARLGEIIEDAAAQLRELRPPGPSEDEHSDLIAGFDGLAETYAEFAGLPRDDREARLFADSVTIDEAARALKLRECRSE